jgi:hypothetical protein
MANDGRRTAWGPLAWLLLALAALHAVATLQLSTSTAYGDEPHYLEVAFEDADRGHTSLLPGKQRFDDSLSGRGSQPLYWARVLAVLADSHGDPSDMAGLLDVSVWLNLLLLLATVACVYALAATLGAGTVGSCVAAALIGLFPWYTFYAHTAWPEPIHGLLQCLVLLLLVRHLRGASIWWLALTGVALGFALLIKSTLQSFVPVFAVFVGLAPLVRGPASAKAALRGLCAVALLVGGLALVVVPQLATNEENGHGWRIAAHTWWNLETGLGMPAPRDDPKAFTEPEGTRPYWRDLRIEFVKFNTPAAREAAARKRTLALLESRPVTETLSRQFEKLVWVVTDSETPLARALRKERWGPEPPGWISLADQLAWFHWFGLLILGTLGLLTGFWRGAGPLLLTAFTAAFVVAMLAVPLKLRFAMPLVPVLSVFAGLAVGLVTSRGGTSSVADPPPG